MIAPRRVVALWWYHSITKVAIAQLSSPLPLESPCWLVQKSWLFTRTGEVEILITNCRILMLQVLYVEALPSMHIGVTLFKTCTTQWRFRYGHESIFGARPWYSHQDWPNAEVHSSIPVGSCCCDGQVCRPPHKHWDVGEDMQRDER